MLIENVYASGEVKKTLDSMESFTSLSDLFGFVTNLIIGIGWALVFVMLALGFVQYVLSRGEKTAVDAAQKWLTYAVIGGVGLFFIGFLKGIIPQLIGVDGDGPDTGGDISGF